MTNLSKQLRCDVCGDPAMVSILKDAFGKSDQTGSFCAVHAPKHSAIHLPEAPLTSNLEAVHGRVNAAEFTRLEARISAQQVEIERLRAALEQIGGTDALGVDKFEYRRIAQAALSGDSSAPEGDCSAGVGGVTLVQMAENIKLGLDPYTERDTYETTSVASMDDLVTQLRERFVITEEDSLRVAADKIERFSIALQRIAHPSPDDRDWLSTIAREALRECP